MKNNSIIIIILLACISSPLFSDNKKLAEEHLKKADSLNKNKKYEEAEVYYKKADETAPGMGRYAFRLGQFYVDSLQKYSDAIPCFERAIQNGYAHPWVYRKMGQSYYNMQKYLEAEQYYQEGIKIGHVQLGDTKDDAKKKDAIQEIIRIYGRLGYIYNDLGKWNKTITTLMPVQELDTEADTIEYINALSNAYWWQGHVLFGQEKYGYAEDCFKKAYEYSKKNKNTHKTALNREIKFHIDIAKKRKTLGTITPDYVHKILAISVNEVDIDTKTMDGKSLKGHTFLTTRQKEMITISQASLKQYWETFSNGKLSLEYDIIVINNVLKNFKFREKDRKDNRFTEYKEIREPDLDSFMPDINQLIYDNYQKYDTFIIYWNGENGLSTYANGGGRQYPLLSYNLYVTRGYSHISAERLLWNGPALLLHEQMHNIESMLSQNLTIDANENSRKEAYPSWEGTGEINYFSYLFKDVVPKLLKDSKKFPNKKGWINFNRREKNPFFIDKEQYNKLVTFQKSIPLENQKKAHQLYFEGKELSKKNKRMNAINKMEQAHMLNPYHIEAMESLGWYLENEKQYEKSVEIYKKSVNLFLNVWTLTRLGSVLCWKMNKIDEGIPYFEKALSIDPENPYRLKTYINIGYAYLKKKSFEKALKYYDEGIEFGNKWKNVNQKDFAECYYYKGLILGQEMGNIKEGMFWVNEAQKRGYDEKKCKILLEKLNKKN